MLVALITAGFIARGILRPVDEAARAARRIAGGDLTARVPAGAATSSGAGRPSSTGWPTRSRTTVGRLETAQQQNRRFVADVAHELRTPLTALVAEASLIESGLAGMTPDARRAAELLVADVRRLRVLVDELMEISRFDADAEQPSLEPVDLGRVVTAVVASRLPAAAIALPASRWSWSPIRAASTGSWATSSTTPATTRPGGPVEVSLRARRWTAR